MKHQNEQNAEQNKPREEKKQYTRPELVKHGNVESLTLGNWYPPRGSTPV
jgi:hypothetical protein